ncbi:hypothetical protein HZC31_03430 [Candidatus Woesearchaeota archaeon]|nr:hypothetical protein [Candidatus Woesearchaeota archaeon]
MEKHNVQDLSTIEWHFWHVRKRPALLIYFFYHGSTCRATKEFPCYIPVSGQIADHVVTKKADLETFRKKLWEKFQKNPEFILHFMKEMYTHNEKDISTWRALAKKDFSDEKNSILIQEYEKYVEQLLAYTPAIYLPLALEPLLSEECLKVIKEKYPEKAEEWYDVIMTSVKESEVIEERKSLLTLAQKYNKHKDKNKMKEDMQKHIERFSFLKQKDMFLEFFDEEYYFKKIEECKDPEKELASLEQETKKKESNFAVVLDAWKDNYFVQLLFKTTNEAVYFRTWRTERFSQSTYYLIPLFKEIAIHLSLEKYQDVVYLLPEEVVSLLKSERSADKKLIEQRKIGFTYMTFGSDENLIIQGDDALKSLNHLKLPNHTGGIITGTPAFKGVVQGKVTLITKREQWSSIQKAEILVIHTTTPDIVPYLKNIKAIVTEEGGILSHASVISREMKIPCIIGTKIATKAFKDGDIVEVDAEKGIVKKIK